MRFIQPFDQWSFRVAEIGNCLVGRQGDIATLSARSVECGVAADEDEPRDRISGRPVLRPISKRTQASLLISLFGGVHVAKVAKQRADRLRPRRSQRAVNPGWVVNNLGHLSRL